MQRRGHPEGALPLLQSAIAAAERDSHQIAQIGTLNNLGVMHLALHQYPNAIASLEQALQLAHRISDADKETMCLHNLATVHLSNGDAELAAQLHSTVLAACQAAGNAMGEASARHKLGDDLRQMGRYDEAATPYTTALKIRERMGSLRGQGTLHAALAALHLGTGNPERALGHGERALDLHGQARDDPGLCDALVLTADIRRTLRAPHEAIQDAERAASSVSTWAIPAAIAAPSRHWQTHSPQPATPHAPTRRAPRQWHSWTRSTTHTCTRSTTACTPYNGHRELPRTRNAVPVCRASPHFVVPLQCAVARTWPENGAEGTP
ncbi:hypothetical protein GCM10027610_024600 [Dactylosporangium cerinum]